VPVCAVLKLQPQVGVPLLHVKSQPEQPPGKQVSPPHEARSDISPRAFMLT
jgi:hypothetical protein